MKAALAGRLFMATVLLLVAAGCNPQGGAGRDPSPVDVNKPVQALIKSGRHSDLHWPAFSDSRTQLRALYKRSGGRPLWLWGPKPSEAAIALIERLAACDSLGLEPADYDAVWLGTEAADLAKPAVPLAKKRLARFELAVSIAAVRFTTALQSGRVSPRVAKSELFKPAKSVPTGMVVDSLRDRGQQDEILARLQPRLLHYQLLKNGLSRYRALARDTSLLPLPALPRSVKPGMRLAAAPQLRRLLEAIGDLPRGGGVRAAVDTRYSPDLVAAVKAFQTRQGYEPNGGFDAATVARLNRPFEQRVRQIELALERYRWMPSSFKAPPIIVNIPAFRVEAWRTLVDREDDMLAMDVVVGSAGEQQTPVFAADMQYLIFRPYWEVPASIMLEELAPKAMEDPQTLEDSDMVLVEGEADDAAELPPTRDNIEKIGKGLRLRQRPGDQNALGLVKFLLPNSYNVYLHDTPAKGLFSRARRDESHGCIRLSDPPAMAAHVLRDQPDWSPEKIQEAMHGEDNHRVNLTSPIPVYIVYMTAVARENGDVNFYSDVYGMDRELDRILRGGYPYPR